MKILLIEDEKPIALCLEQRLKDIGASVDIAKTWEEAAAQIKLNHYDIVSLDVILPDSGVMDAPKRIEFIRAVMPDSKIVVVSGIDIDALEKISIAADVAFIPKASAVIGPALALEILKAVEGRKGFEENIALLQKATRSGGT